MKTYNFKIVVEPDGERWHAWCPALVDRGGASLIEHGEPLPQENDDQVRIFPEPIVAVIV